MDFMYVTANAGAILVALIMCVAIYTHAEQTAKAITHVLKVVKHREYTMDSTTFQNMLWHNQAQLSLGVSLTAFAFALNWPVVGHYLAIQAAMVSVCVLYVWFKRHPDVANQ